MDPISETVNVYGSAPNNSKMYADLFTQMGQNLVQFVGQRQQNQHNIKLAEDGRTHELKMWNLQADYNHPQNQMERLRAAGLNPHLVYGKPGEATGNMGNKPGTHIAQVENEMANVEMPQVMALLESVQKYDNLKKQNELMNAQTHNQWKQAKRADESAQSARMDWLKKQRLYSKEYDLQQAEAEVEQTRSNVERIKAETKLKNIEAEINEMLKKDGFTQADHWGIRAVIRLLKAIGINPFQMIEDNVNK